MSAAGGSARDRGDGAAPDTRRDRSSGVHGSRCNEDTAELCAKRRKSATRALSYERLQT